MHIHSQLEGQLQAARKDLDKAHQQANAAYQRLEADMEAQRVKAEGDLQAARNATDEAQKALEAKVCVFVLWR